MVKSGNSCEDMLAVGGRLKLKREMAERGVRNSWGGTSEGGELEGSGWWDWKEERMVTGVWLIRTWCCGSLWRVDYMGVVVEVK